MDHQSFEVISMAKPASWSVPKIVLDHMCVLYVGLIPMRKCYSNVETEGVYKLL